MRMCLAVVVARDYCMGEARGAMCYGVSQGTARPTFLSILDRICTRIYWRILYRSPIENNEIHVQNVSIYVGTDTVYCGGRCLPLPS